MQQYADTLLVMFMAIFTSLTFVSLVAFAGYWYIEARREKKIRQELVLDYERLRSQSQVDPYPTITRLRVGADIYTILDSDRFNQEEIEEIIFHLGLSDPDLSVDNFPRETKRKLLIGFWGYVQSRNLTNSVKDWIIENRVDIKL